MTGKEALEDLYYSNLDAFIDIEETNEQVEIIKKELKLLVKYKMAFEILKDTYTLICYKGEKYYLLGDLRNEITKEEAKLIKELMKDV